MHILLQLHSSAYIPRFIGCIVSPPKLNVSFFFFFSDPAPTEISPFPLHDALPFCRRWGLGGGGARGFWEGGGGGLGAFDVGGGGGGGAGVDGPARPAVG